MERFTVPAAAQKEMRTSHAVALRRCRPPLNLSVQHEGQRLAGFFLQGKHYVVREAYGPWRRSGEWWSSQMWSSEEWDVRAEAGANANATLLCLITHDLLQHQWQLEALYD